MLRLIEKGFEGSNHQSCYAADGLEALGRLVREKFELVVASAQLPEIDGMTLLQTTKLLKGHNAQAKFFILTSSAEEVSKYEGPFAADTVLVKNEGFLKNLRNLMMTV